MRDASVAQWSSVQFFFGAVTRVRPVHGRRRRVRGSPRGLDEGRPDRREGVAFSAGAHQRSGRGRNRADATLDRWRDRLDGDVAEGKRVHDGAKHDHVRRVVVRTRQHAQQVLRAWAAAVDERGPHTRDIFRVEEHLHSCAEARAVDEVEGVRDGDGLLVECAEEIADERDERRHSSARRDGREREFSNGSAARESGERGGAEAREGVNNNKE